MNRKFVILALVVIATAGLLAGCTTADSGNETNQTSTDAEGPESGTDTGDDGTDSNDMGSDSDGATDDGDSDGQREDTGTESTEQVSDRVNVITEIGEVGDNNEIDKVRLGLQPAAGSDDVDLAELTLQFVSDDNFTNLVVAEDESRLDADDSRATGDSSPDDVNPQSWQRTNGGSSQRYGVAVITAESEDDLVMTENSDRYELIINTSGERWDGPAGEGTFPDGTDLPGETLGEFVGPLTEGVDVEITITTEVGSQTVVMLSVPDSLSASSDGETVNL